MTVYLIHFAEPLRVPYCGRNSVTRIREIRHYIGATQLSLDDRIRRHHTDRGAAILRELNKRGIEWRVARVWSADNREEVFEIERRLKQGHRHRRFCLWCRGRYARIEP